jgi:hypothetical protein
VRPPTFGVRRLSPLISWCSYVLTLRTHIGQHRGRLPGELYQRELTSLIIRAGRAGGLGVLTELPVLSGAIDCAWYSPGFATLLVAWEFDGRDVGDGHIAGTSKRLGNAKKFAACGALRKIQVLYALRNNLKYWGSSRAHEIRTLLAPDVEIMTDRELMADGGIEKVIDEVRALADLPPLRSGG